MENKTNKLIAAQYQLFTISDNGERTLVEETTKEQPFVFITGFDAALDALEERLENLKLGEKFDFELEKEQAFGEYEPNRSSTSENTRPLFSRRRSIRYSSKLPPSPSSVGSQPAIKLFISHGKKNLLPSINECAAGPAGLRDGRQRRA